MAWLWLPETVHRVHAGTGNPLRYLPELLQRPILRRILAIDFVFWFALAIFQTTFGLFVARRFGFDAALTGYLFAGFGLLSTVVQGGFIRPIVRRLGDKTTFVVGLVFSAIGLAAASVTYSVPVFVLILVPLVARDGSRACRRFRASSAARPEPTSRAAFKARRARSRA